MDTLHVLALTWLAYTVSIATVLVFVFQALIVLGGPALIIYAVFVRPYLEHRRG